MAQQFMTVSPELTLRPSLSGPVQNALQLPVGSVAGANAPAFVERRGNRQLWRLRSGVAGANAPAFVERRPIARPKKPHCMCRRS